MDAFESQMTPSAGHPTAYVWAPDGSPATIRLSFDAVDRMNFDVMRGFGAVPRRGAEVGGILLGRVESGERTVIHVEDFVAVPCDYLRGPSYLLSEADLARLDEAMAKTRGPVRGLYPVGYYRSNTRENLQLHPEDVALLDGRFPEGPVVCLLIKPFATRISEAVFYVRQDGRYLPEGEAEAFPFRRKEMGGGAPTRPPRMGSLDAMSPPPAEREPAPAPAGGAPEASMFQWAGDKQDKTVTTEADVRAVAPRSRFSGGWVWIPLSFIFLLLGVVLGFQIALGFRNSQAASVASDPFTLDLSVAKYGENLLLKWNTAAQPMRNAKRGELRVQDGDNVKTVVLNEEDLARGSALYRHVSNTVVFRLEIYPRERNGVSETMEYHGVSLPAAAEPGAPADEGPAAKGKRGR